MPAQKQKKEKINQILIGDLDIEAKLKSADFEIKEYIDALEKKITEIHQKYFKIKADNVSVKAENASLNRRISELEKVKGNIIFQSSHKNTSHGENA